MDRPRSTLEHDIRISKNVKRRAHSTRNFLPSHRYENKGIEIKPIINLEGSHELNQVWFNDVRVPKANRVGKENNGCLNICLNSKGFRCRP